MKLAFFAYSIFPASGLSRDLIRIAQVCQSRGHTVDVFTGSWKGPPREDFRRHIIPPKGLTNHAKNQHFQTSVAARLAGQGYDAVVGFNKMPGLDVYFAADTCFRQKALRERGWFYRSLPRCRAFLRDERAVFGPDSDTHCVLLSPEQKQQFQLHYGTNVERLTLVQPGISRERMPGANAPQVRAVFRGEYGLGEDELVLLMVGSGFATKGVDRAIKAFAELDPALQHKTWLYVVGDDAPSPYQRLASKLGVRPRVQFFGSRDDVQRFMCGADALLQPSIRESAGAVILESIVCGLPVLATAVCGNAGHIEAANAGLVVPSPFDQRVFTQLVTEVLTSPRRQEWSENGLHYGSKADLYSMPDKVADLIEQVARRNHA